MSLNTGVALEITRPTAPLTYRVYEGVALAKQRKAEEQAQKKAEKKKAEKKKAELGLPEPFQMDTPGVGGVPLPKPPAA
jgi:hypothetical protein